MTTRTTLGQRKRVALGKDTDTFCQASDTPVVNVAALYEHPDEAAVYEPWVIEFAALRQAGEAGAYVGFLGHEGEGRIREDCPGKTLERLAEIKGRYEPTNPFRLNQNIRPEAQSASESVS